MKRYISAVPGNYGWCRQVLDGDMPTNYFIRVERVRPWFWMWQMVGAPFLGELVEDTVFDPRDMFRRVDPSWDVCAQHGRYLRGQRCPGCVMETPPESSVHAYAMHEQAQRRRSNQEPPFRPAAYVATSPSQPDGGWSLYAPLLQSEPLNYGPPAAPRPDPEPEPLRGFERYEAPSPPPPSYSSSSDSSSSDSSSSDSSSSSSSDSGSSE